MTIRISVGVPPRVVQNPGGGRAQPVGVFVFALRSLGFVPLMPTQSAFDGDPCVCALSTRIYDVRRTVRHRPSLAHARLRPVRPWLWARSVLLPLIELPIRVAAALWAGGLVWGWLEGEGVVYVDLLESRFLVLAVGGAAALAAVAAPILTTRPALWAAELLSRLGPFQLAGAALGAILGLTIGLLLVQPLPRPEAGLGAWLPFFVTAGCGLAGALAFAGRPALLRRLLVRQVSAARPATSPRVALLPEVTPHPNGHAPAELEAPTRERAP